MPQSPPSAPCVEFSGVDKDLGGQAVLRGIDLRLPAAAISAVVGESGSGKSTLLEHINGLLQPDRGEVRVFDTAVSKRDPVGLRREIGYAVQGIGLFPHLTVDGNLRLLPRLAGREPSAIDARRDALMQLMDLDPELKDRFPHELSGGQQQRVGLCRAMMLAPPLLLLDEPFSGVDPITRRGIHARFLALHAAEPISVVLVTHDLAEAFALASHIVILRAGRVLQSGPIDAVRAAPTDAYVADLLEERIG